MWFKPQHQQRGRGEPAVLAALTQSEAARTAAGEATGSMPSVRTVEGRSGNGRPYTRTVYSGRSPMFHPAQEVVLPSAAAAVSHSPTCIPQP